ncbi:glycosyltransferase [Amycolatopsis sp. A133]|uniref:glycosyltransferase n=1 Tax=Amycolatopsis sp. A133 TaxID=3064472 RepID=UPI0027FAA344|nr:glycosyltransferase [Amycolatopsis sp. A133]MDQ7803981.1 glycosyltransferase [Amycolatopsis sp. A133]
MAKGTSGERLIEWTGERCVPWTDDLQVIYEHYHRYAFAARFAEGKRVLDLAAGEGYGSALLARAAAGVVGLEIDPQTVGHARNRYPHVRFEVGSITDPQALDGEVFDVITCFEAIEHVDEQDRLMELVRNRLAPGGVFLCSTPDVEVYTHDHGNKNPYHVHELTESAFRSLLSASFEHVVVLRQNVAVGSLIHDNGAGTGAEVLTLQAGDDDGWVVEPGAPHTYFVSVASAEPIDVPSTSAMVDPKLTLVARAAAEAGRLRDGLDRAEAARAEATASVARLTSELAQVTAAEQRAATERDEALRQAQRAREDRQRAAGELNRLQRKAGYDRERLEWLAGNNTSLSETIGRLAAENEKLRAETSALVQRAIGKYRGTIERYAPRGTRRRDFYETALGRPAGVLPGAPVAEPGPVAVTTSDQPIVSVVIPVYGNWRFTRGCLDSIQRHLPSTPFEVIVVDDASPDDSAGRVAGCAGVRLVRAPKNLGFVGACNLGAEHARGDFVMFLNNDTEVRPGWLDELVAVVETRPDVGLVGSKLVYPDGRLQECGGIIWADGTGWNYGRLQSPDAPWFQALRDVDYCSGAALLVRRELFERIGGFDKRFAPAYYEDTDLAFAVRAAGYRTVVQPASVVVHHEGITNGTDVSSGVKRHQELNRGVFVDKWSVQLRDHFPEASPRAVWAGRQRTKDGHRGGTVLVADHQVPMPDKDSGSVRMFRILELLVGLGQRVVFMPLNNALPEPYADALYRAGVTVVTGLGEQLEFLRDAGPDLSLAVLSRPHVAWQLLEQVREHAPDCVIAYDTVDLHFVRLNRQADLAAQLGNTREELTLRRRAEVLRESELGLTRATDVTFVVSDVERELLRELVPSARVEVLSNVHYADGSVAVPDGRSGVLFVGSFDHLPNRDAARWLATEIMPLVRRRRPDAVAQIVGSNPPQEMFDLERDGVVVRGWVPDLGSAYREARVVVAPLRFGAGVKGKLGESLGYGVPVVATPLAVEGMHLTHGRDVLVGGSAQELADEIVTLLEDDKLWQRLSEEGKTLVDRLFGADVARDALAGVLDRRG